MPQNALVLSPNNSRAAVYDRDAINYFSRAGVTDATAKAQINAFVKGVKNLGLYNSMVCWPMRSTQNIASGNTVYSLGGLQISNATKVGGTWGTDGIFFSGSSEYMSSDMTNVPKDVTIFLSGKGNGSGYSIFPCIGGINNPAGHVTSGIYLGNSASGGNTALQIAQPSGSQVTSDISSGLSSASSFVALSGSYKRNTVFNVRNLSSATVGTQGTYLADEATTLTKMSLNGRWSGTAGDRGNPMTASFFALITPNCDSVISSFHTLYKTTLGSGLGLP
jgi:hypothetical protein